MMKVSDQKHNSRGLGSAKNLGYATLTLFGMVFAVFLMTATIWDIPLGYAQDASGQTTQDNDSEDGKSGGLTTLVINEVDTNPAGADHSSRIEWVELYNTGTSEVDIGGWQIGPTSVSYKDFTIPDGTKIGANKYLVFTHYTQWFFDTGESVRLVSPEGDVVDKTPRLKDAEDNVNSWQRKSDGLDTDSESDWVFARATLGSSNAQYSSASSNDKKEEPSITVDTNKHSYDFGDTIEISGKVSEKKINYAPTYSPEAIKLKIKGPDGYSDSTSLYPSLDLTYKSKIKASKVLGIKEGKYTVSATYGETRAQTEFAVGEVRAPAKQQPQDAIVTFDTDKKTYKPGETVRITAFATKILPLQGLKFKVVDPNGNTAYDGTLFPDSRGIFSVKIFLSTSNPLYGNYTISGTYDGVVNPASFEVVKEQRETVPVSLKTDKKVYGPGGTVIITGRSNKAWVPSLDITITKSFSTKIEKGQMQNTYRFSDIVRLEGDSTFRYEFKVPSNENRFGTYFVKVSKDVGSATTSFKVVEDPIRYEKESKPDQEPLTVNVDKAFYEVGNALSVTGETTTQSVGGSTGSIGSVKIIIKKADGSPISFQSTSEGLRDKEVEFSFTVSPDSSGQYSVKQTLIKNAFNEGKYEVIAKFGSHTAKTSFSVVDITTSDTQGVDLVAKTDKEVYTPGDKITLDGKFTKPVSVSAVDIKIKKPEAAFSSRKGQTDSAGVINSAARVENSKFVWNWQIPQYYSSFGVHKMTISSESQAMDLFFRIESPSSAGQQPGQETANQKKIVVKTDQEEYETGSFVKILGSVDNKKESSKGGHQTGDRPQITVKNQRLEEVFSGSPSLSRSGNFETSFRLVPTAYKTGEYAITAKYQDERAKSSFRVIESKFDFDPSDKLQIDVKTDKGLYTLGDTVVIKGAANKPVPNSNTITVTVANDKIESCSNYFRNCDPSAPKQTLTFDSAMQFETTHKIPAGSPSKNTGNYTVIAKTGFGSAQEHFEVVEQLPSHLLMPDDGTQEPQEESKTQTTNNIMTPGDELQTPGEDSKQDKNKEQGVVAVPEKLFENFNRITNSPIKIELTKKEIDSQPSNPKMVNGLLRTVKESDHSVTNVRVFYKDTCVIGQSGQCLISGSTRTLRSIYNDVELDGNQYRIRYTGPDAKLEKFSIVPFDENKFLPESEWNVNIDGKENVFRFYYKIMYLSQN